jgi:hypothetical protein
MIVKSRLVLCEAVGLAIFIFGLLIWGYAVIIQVTHPTWLPDTLSHHAFPPLNWRIDDAGIIGFTIAPFGFSMWYFSRAYLLTSERGRK